MPSVPRTRGKNVKRFSPAAVLFPVAAERRRVSRLPAGSARTHVIDASVNGDTFGPKSG